jgi:hypothetical protein
MGKEHKHSSVRGTMIKVYFPTFPLLDTHPGALKGKITDKMAGQPDKQHWHCDTDERGNHRLSFSSPDFYPSIGEKKSQNNELNLLKYVMKVTICRQEGGMVSLTAFNS